jgi:hypothetical protein
MKQRLPGERYPLHQFEGVCNASPRKHQFRILGAAMYHDLGREDDDPKLTLNIAHDYDNRLMTEKGANWFDNYLTVKFQSYGLSVKLIRRLPAEEPNQIRFFVDATVEGATDRLYGLLFDLSREGERASQTAHHDNMFALAA